MKPAPDRIYDTLKRYWGFTEFRPVQLEIIRSVLEGRDTLARELRREMIFIPDDELDEFIGSCCSFRRCSWFMRIDY